MTYFFKYFIPINIPTSSTFSTGTGSRKHFSRMRGISLYNVKIKATDHQGPASGNDVCRGGRTGFFVLVVGLNASFHRQIRRDGRCADGLPPPASLDHLPVKILINSSGLPSSSPPTAPGRQPCHSDSKYTCLHGRNTL